MADTKIYDGTSWRAGSEAKVWDGTQWVPLTSGTGGGGIPETPAWVRPAEWLPTSVTAGEQKIQTLIAVGAASTPITARQMTVKASGNYTVDWGDGSAPENIASGVVAKHQYTGTGLTALGNGGQALVTITPQSGQTLTSIDMSSPYDTGKTWRGPTMEIVVGPGTITSFTGGPGIATSNGTRLKRVEFKSPVTLSSLTSAWYGCKGLEEIIGTITTNNPSSAFYGCSSLRIFPTVTVPVSPSSIGGMFSGCMAMRQVPSWFSTIDTSATIDFSNLFDGCILLTSVPALNTSAGTNMVGMFKGCALLTSVPAIDTSKATSVSSMFQGCDVLTSIPSLNTALSTTFASTFEGCTLLTTIPTLNTSSGTVFSSTFKDCVSLTSIPTLDTSKGTSFTSMFANCTSLTSVSAPNLALGTTISSVFTGCESLLSIDGPLNASAATSISSIFSNCFSLRNVSFSVGPKISFTVVGMLDAATLNAIYTSLPTVTGQTITVTNVPGTLGDDPTIATAKGWTVTGS